MPSSVPMKRTAGVLIHCTKKGKLKILLVFNGRNWSIPKGKIEANESKRQTALRELCEETQIVGLSGLTYLGYVDKENLERLYCYDAYCDVRPVPSDGIVKAAYFDAERALNIIQQYQRPIIESFLAEQKRTRRKAG